MITNLLAVIVSCLVTNSDEITYGYPSDMKLVYHTVTEQRLLILDVEDKKITNILSSKIVNTSSEKYVLKKVEPVWIIDTNDYFLVMTNSPNKIDTKTFYFNTTK